MSLYVTRRHRDGFECQLPKPVADRYPPDVLVTPEIMAEALAYERKRRNPWENT